MSLQVVPLPQRAPRGSRAKSQNQQGNKKAGNQLMLVSSAVNANTLKNRRRRENKRLVESAIGKKSNTLREVVEDGTLNQVQILSALSKPEECAAFGVPRYNDGCSSQKTAVASPVRVDSLPAVQMKDEQQIFLMRNPAVNMIIPQYAPNAAVWRYDAFMENIPATSAPTTTPSIAFTTTSPIPIDPAYYKINSISTWDKHGDYFLCGKSKGAAGNKRFVWMDVGEVYTIRCSTNINATIDWMWSTLDDGKFQPNAGIVSNAYAAGVPQTIAFAPTERGYYCLDAKASVVGVTATVTEMHVGDTAGGATVLAARHLCMKNYCDNLGTWPALRYLGGSIRYCNTASVLSLQGSLAIADIPSESDWTNFDAYEKVSSVQGAFREDVREGGFARLAFDNKAVDLALQVNSKIEDGVIKDTCWPIEPLSSFLAMSIQISDSAGRQGFIEQWSAVEFTTTDTSRETKTPVIPAEDWLTGMQKLAAIPSKTKNAIHLKQIGASIMSAARSTVRTVLKTGPQVISGIGSGLAIAGMLGAALG